ncbi:cytochrome P450 [Aspergillus stella-maris]|uniref:cytochrome P450 n=1 Tax=Aspergillus stella-maris TaxID=1810926 RepID=UPI003CCCB422
MFTPKPQLTSETSLDAPSPPVVNIPRDIRRSIKVNEAYSNALDKHGPVIVVPRHGRDEYVIDHRYAHEVLTDTKNFTFEKAVFELLHLGFLALFDNGAFVHDVDSLVEKNVQPRMNAIIENIFPVFEEYFHRMEDELPDPNVSKTPVEYPNIFYRIQLAVAHAMVVLILGHAHADSILAGHFAAVAVAMASLTGMHENTHEWVRFPWLWVLLNGFRAIFFTIIPRFFFRVVPILWRSRHKHLENGLATRHGDFAPLFDILLTKHYHGKSGIAALAGFFRCVVLSVGLIFASIHQTVVAGFWILIKLTLKQDEYLPAIREEWESVIPDGELLTVKKLSQLVLLDSFIREVLRTKGDSWGPVRQTTRPVRVGPYVLPKNAMCIVHIARAHQHPDNYGTEGTTFNGFQWKDKERSAVTGTPEFLTFGLGRWACPGRQLAIHEIKIVLYMFFSKFDLKLKGNMYRVANTINTTSVEPEATFLLRRRVPVASEKV